VKLADVRLIGNSLQADLLIVPPSASTLETLLSRYRNSGSDKLIDLGGDLEMMLRVSAVKIVDTLPEIEGWKFVDECVLLGERFKVMIVEAVRSKCPRCWTYTAGVEGDLCMRCVNVLSGQ